MANIREIAKKANVSIATVSRIINNDPRFHTKESTKKAVKKAIDELNYQPQRKTKLTNIGCILSIGAEKYSDPFFTSILASCEIEAEKHNIIFSHVRHYSELKNELILQEFLNSDIKGLIIMEKLPNDMLETIKKKISNIVYIDYDESTEDVNSVGFDHRIANTKAFDYLIQCGYRRIAVIGESSPVTHFVDSIRMSAYREVLAKNKIEFDPTIVKDCNSDLNVCAKQTQELMSLDNPPDVIFVGDDTLANTALAELKRLGYDCPKDVGVMGFNNLPIASHSNPTLTTIDLPMADIGKKAIERIIEIMNNNDRKKYKISFPSELIVRESTRRIK